MKKFLFLLLLVPMIAFGQDIASYWGMHTWSYDSTRVILTNRDTAWVWISYPNEFNYDANTSWPIIIAKTTSAKPTNLKIPYSGENFFNGGFYIGLYPHCAAASTVDSLMVAWSPYDNNGVVFTNDVRYCKTSDGTSIVAATWNTSLADEGAYGVSSSGEAVNACGIRFVITQRDMSCADTLDFKIWKN